MTHEEKDRIIESQRQRITSLESALDSLMGRISELEHKKSSKNSSIPPSRDPHRKRQKSLREKSGKKPGGQKDHQGRTKKMVTCPDQVVDHKPQYCQHCSNILDEELNLIGRRQVIDIPPIKPIITEHRIYAGHCNSCGQKSACAYPQGVKGNVSYGPHIEALAVYLNVRQYMPYQRMSEYFNQILGIDISQGTLVNLIRRSAEKAQPIYQSIKERVSKAVWLGSDETGCKVNGQTHWYWTWQNEELTYITASHTRGFATVEEQFPDGLKDSILVSDCLAAQLKQDCKAHQICIAHLYRDLNYLIEKDMEQWSSQVKELLQKACALKKEMDYSKFATYQDQILEIPSE